MSPSGGKPPQHVTGLVSLTLAIWATRDRPEPGASPRGAVLSADGASGPRCWAARYWASGIVGRLMLRPAGIGTLGSTGAVARSTVVAGPTLVCPVIGASCARAPGGNAVSAANKAAPPAAYNHPLPGLLLVICVSCVLTYFAGRRAPRRRNRRPP